VQLVSTFSVRLVVPYRLAKMCKAGFSALCCPLGLTKYDRVFESLAFTFFKQTQVFKMVQLENFFHWLWEIVKMS